MNWRWPALCLAVAAAPAACDVDPREPSVLKEDGDAGLGGSSPGGSGSGGTSGASGSGGADAGASGGGGVSGSGGSGVACGSGMKSCGGDVCIAELECCESCGVYEQCGNGACVCAPDAVSCGDSCLAPGLCCTNDDCGAGTCGAEGQCECAAGFFGRRCDGRLVGVGFADPLQDASEVRDVSGDGNVVVGWSGNGTDRFAARWVWQDGVSTLLGSLGGTRTSIALAADADGSVVVGDAAFVLFGGDGPIGFRWVQGENENEMQAVADTVEAVAEFIHTEGVSADGNVMVGWADDEGGPSVASRWEGQGNMQTFSRNPDSVQIRATDAAGEVLGGFFAGGIPIVFFTNGAGFQLPSLGQFTSGQVNGISADGSTFVGRLRGGDAVDRAIRWSGLTNPENLGPGIAHDTSADGAVVVGESGGAAMLWDTAGARALAAVVTSLGGDLAGFELLVAHAVSDDGRVIAGAGRRATRDEGWVLRLPSP
jgi:uncharacterized membrane protein